MNPMFAVWWLMHRGLIDPSLTKTLTKQQKRTLFKQARLDSQRGLISKCQFWITVTLVAAIWLLIAIGPLNWIMPWARTNLGPLGPAIAVYGCGTIGALVVWRLSRRLVERSMYQSLREFGYDVCSQCGYWLRSLPDDVQKCPECGAGRERKAEGSS